MSKLVSMVLLHLDWYKRFAMDSAESIKYQFINYYWVTRYFWQSMQLSHTRYRCTSIENGWIIAYHWNIDIQIYSMEHYLKKKSLKGLLIGNLNLPAVNMNSNRYIGPATFWIFWVHFYVHIITPSCLLRSKW